jgi:acyl-coenzyme A synthetase/AMP-(fatty) acid ligase
VSFLDLLHHGVDLAIVRGDGSRHKALRAAHFVESLSKTSSGKVQKYRLRDLVG